jgi:methylglutaconyl-CoA hydratase
MSDLINEPSNPLADPLVENLISEDVAAAPVRLEATPEGVAVVTIDRPQHLNAFDQPLIAALAEIFETLRGAEGVRIVFLRGAGGVFSTGADLNWTGSIADLSEADNHADAMATARMLKALSELPALTVALVEGQAFGVGAGLVAVCDMAAATKAATFSFPEVRLGLTPAVVSHYVVNAIGPRAAKALFLTGRAFDAGYAERIGLIHDVVADSAALEAWRARLSSEVMECAPGALADAKHLVWEVWDRPIDHDLIEHTARRMARERVSEEGREGVAALMANRKPSWTQP